MGGGAKAERGGTGLRQTGIDSGALWPPFTTHSNASPARHQTTLLTPQVVRLFAFSSLPPSRIFFLNAVDLYAAL